DRRSLLQDLGAQEGGNTIGVIAVNAYNQSSRVGVARTAQMKEVVVGVAEHRVGDGTCGDVFESGPETRTGAPRVQVLVIEGHRVGRAVGKPERRGSASVNELHGPACGVPDRLPIVVAKMRLRGAANGKHEDDRIARGPEGRSRKRENRLR